MSLTREQPATLTRAENPLTAGLERLPVPATTLVIFGASGDLARRKLLPALYGALGLVDIVTIDSVV